MEEQQNRRNLGVVKISIFITSIFVIFISISYAFLNQTLAGVKRQVITSGNLQLSLEEKNEVSLINALPMYDEVGMIQTPFKFSLTNKSSESVDYKIKLEDVTEGTNKLGTSLVKYGIEKDEEVIKDLLSNLTDNTIDTGTIAGNQIIEYSLRLWIDSNVSDESTIKDKTLSYKLKIEEIQIPVKKKVLLATMKQGDYVAYVGNNGCQNNGVDITGESDAESKNSCFGWNANQTDVDSETYGYCHYSSYKFTVSGWRIAYTEENRAYLISAGSPECNTRPSSTGNAQYIELANEKAKKYCNVSFVDGDCSDNSDSWAIGDTDFYKMTSAMNDRTGYHLVGYYGIPTCNGTSTASCNNNLINNGGFYWFAAAYDASNPYGVYWSPSSQFVRSDSYASASGLRPIIRLSSSVYITGGEGTMESPYTIAND